ncbi:conserved exported protein of unknown function [Nitrospira sp. KM1]|nr:conserved exported protein of unknown function [Nitrospira sp. KM1]
MSDNRSAASMLMLLFSGIALGATGALLLAPQSGWRSRKSLRRYARRAGDGLRELAGRAGEVFEDLVDEGKDLAEAKESVLREAFEAGRASRKQKRKRKKVDT